MTVLDIPRPAKRTVQKGGERLNANHRFIIVALLLERGRPVKAWHIAKIFDISERSAYRLLRVARTFTEMDNESLIEAMQAGELPTR